MRKILSLLMMMVFSVAMFAATETTVYYTASSDVIGKYTVKLNTNQQTNPDVWKTYVMTKTDLSYNGDPVYSASFSDLWDGVDKMQFQLYDGDTWKSQDQPISSWASASTYNGKMYVHATGKWEDAPSGAVSNVTLYFVNAEDWDGEIIEDSDRFDFGMGDGLLKVYDVGPMDRRAKIFVKYTAGYDSTAIPLVKEIACNSVVRALTSSYGVTSETAGGVSISYSSTWSGRGSGALTDDTRETLGAYKVKGVY